VPLQGTAVSPGDAFAGFGLQVSGAVDVLAKHVIPRSAGPTLSILALIGLAALLSGFMNNIGALALLIPVAIQMAAKLNLSAGQVLMPLAFGSILGGMTTLIGTPPQPDCFQLSRNYRCR
jgi:Na+/H+ antiporter NhaD/arsenite permease-like protein